ncbi:MAG TPA: hypothetical protein VMA83_11570 [Solirubrobacteraceae bacterium]|nr:hypothetical protein [Solirubrobacteraceae bacterium]
MVLGTTHAFIATFGLAVTFLGIGAIATILIVYILIQVRGERRENKEFLNARGDKAD